MKVVLTEITSLFFTKIYHGEHLGFKGLFFVEHNELDLYEKFQVDWAYGIRGMEFLCLNHNVTIWPIGLILLVKHLHFISSYWARFCVLAHYSSWQFEPRQKTTNYTYNTQKCI